MLFAFRGSGASDPVAARASLGPLPTQGLSQGQQGLGQGLGGGMNIGAFLQALMRFAQEYGRRGRPQQAQPQEGMQTGTPPGMYGEAAGYPGASQPGIVRQPEAIKQGGIVAPWQGADPWTTALPESGEGKPLGIL